MKKDVVYSMRMSSRVRDALKEAAKKDRRSVASLLDKIVLDYLENEGFLKEEEFDTEGRRFPRKKITMPAKTFIKAESEYESFPSVVLDISMGGVLVTYPKGSKIRFTSKGDMPQFELRLEHPHADEELHFDCEARHMRDTGNEIQIGAVFKSPGGDDLQKLNKYLN